jgi:predicted RNase H-like nuclease (RuvC/YqgF family)
LKINEQLRTQKDQQKDIGAGGDDRKYKLLEEMNEKYKKEITRLQGELEEKAREIGRLRSETRGID